MRLPTVERTHAGRQDVPFGLSDSSRARRRRQGPDHLLTHHPGHPGPEPFRLPFRIPNKAIRQLKEKDR
eukprot:scaffold113447_cov37-Prasinocladus_malaysianus.AAC.3